MNYSEFADDRQLMLNHLSAMGEAIALLKAHVMKWPGRSTKLDYWERWGVAAKECLPPLQRYVKLNCDNVVNGANQLMADAAWVTWVEEIEKCIPY